MNGLSQAVQLSESLENLKKREKSSEHDIVFYMLCGGITAISPNVRESGKILPTEPGFLGFGIRNTTQEIRNPSIHR